MYERPTTPNLDELATKSRTYLNAYSTSGWTPPAHASLFTGLYSITHETTQERPVLQLGLTTMAEILTDNGSCYVSRKFRQACKRHRLRHIRTKPYRPQTNGKAERFIQTMLMGWAYKRPYRTSNQRRKALPAWLRYYNHERPHRALGMISPKTKIRRAA